MFGMVQPKMGGNNTVSFYMDKWLESVRVFSFSTPVVSNLARIEPRSQGCMGQRTQPNQGHSG